MYWHKTPHYIQNLYPGLTWHKPRDKKTLYITFDDGPVPGVTPKVLDILAQYDAKATFFCVGDNVRKHPEVYQQLIKSGHTTANHTYSHLNGWKTKRPLYLENIQQCEVLLQQKEGKKLFRPPYGKVRRKVASQLKSEYEIVMWDVLSGDFDVSISPLECLQNTIKATRSGSIIIFHDSVKAEERMLYALPRFLEHFQKKGFQFAAL